MSEVYDKEVRRREPRFCRDSCRATARLTPTALIILVERHNARRRPPQGPYTHIRTLTTSSSLLEIHHGFLYGDSDRRYPRFAIPIHQG